MKTFKKLLGWAILVGILSTYIGALMHTLGSIQVLKVLGCFGAVFGVIALVVVAVMLVDGEL